jgi:flagellar hook protein FlgE
MSILTSMYTSVSGLKSHGQALSVVANNIANASTNGFKSSRAEFQDALSSASGAVQIGRGTKLGAVTSAAVQGNIDNTERLTDIAISGSGYFVVDGYDGRAFTRDGEFRFDKDGYLITADNYKVQGFEVDSSGGVTNKLGAMRLPDAIAKAVPTNKVNIHVNLDSRIQKGKVFDIKSPYETADFNSGIEVFDSQGSKHLVNLAFNKLEDGVWEYRGLVDGSEVVGGVPGQFSQVVRGRLTFNGDGLLNTEEILEKNFNFSNGAKPNQDIVFDFGDAIATDGGNGLKGTKQYGAKSDLMSWSQDGSASGQLTGLAIDDTGILAALYSNGETKDLYQIAVATFQSPEGLFKSGSNKLRESRDSGSPAIGKPAEAGRGQVFSKSIERSTTDIAKEFVDMIQYQRNFQANAKGITTSDEMLTDVLNVKR